VILPSSKPSSLLAALLLHANNVVSVPYLQRAIWGEEPPETAKAALQTCVLRLRRVFAKHGIPAGTIETLPDGYRVNADGRSLDLIRFRELCERAFAFADPVTGPDLAAELALLREAVRLWRGRPILVNVNSELLQRDLVPRVSEEWLRAVERTYDIELALGRCREVLAELMSTAHSHPAHERFWEQLIEALYRTGRRAEALAEYRRVKEHLLEGLGIDPGPALQRLEIAVLRGDPLGQAAGPAVVRLAAVGPGTVWPAAAGPMAVGPAEAGAMAAGPTAVGQSRASASWPQPAGPGSVVLQRLLQAGLLEAAPHGDYRMNELLHFFTCAAAGEHNTPALQGALPYRPTGT
jgi:DNA-binding SARP family transcriptional activator